MLKYFKLCPLRGCGEIGKRSGFRFQFSQGSEGSSPFIRTSLQFVRTVGFDSAHTLPPKPFITFFLKASWPWSPMPAYKMSFAINPPALGGGRASPDV